MNHTTAINHARLIAYYRRSAQARAADPVGFAERFQRGLRFVNLFVFTPPTALKRNITMHHPTQRLIPGDTILGDDSTGWYSYGPRVLRGASDVETPAEGEAPQFWGVYRWLPDDREWRWVIDVSRREEARALARRLLLNPDYQPEPEAIVP